LAAVTEGAARVHPGVTSADGLTEAWQWAENARPAVWHVLGVLRGPPLVNGLGLPAWIALARGRHPGERLEGHGDSPEAALVDLGNRLRRLA
jgi:hypothetical protein